MPNNKAKGVRAKTRDSHKRRGVRISVNRVLCPFAEGDTVQVNIDSSFHKGIPFRRYQGLSGTVSGKQGDCYRVAVRKGNSPQTLIVHPAHLRRLAAVAVLAGAAGERP